MVPGGRRFEIIVNPIAGAGLALELVEQLVERLAAGGHQAEVFRTAAAGDATRYASQLRGDRIDAILVAGGDGTISEVIEGLACPGGPLSGGRQPPVAILPVGTENLLGKVLGVRPSVPQAEATLLRGATRLLDVGHLVRPPARNDRWDAGAGPSSRTGHFVMIAGAGFDAEVVHRLAQRRAGNISYIDYVGPLVRTFLQYGFPPLQIEADGERICQEPALAFVSNIPRYALGLPICRKAQVDDGLLDLVVFKCSHRGQLLLHSIRTVFGRHLDHPAVTYRQARCVRIRSDQPVALEVDGDDGGQLPVEFSLPGHQVRLLVPPPGD